MSKRKHFIRAQAILRERLDTATKNAGYDLILSYAAADPGNRNRISLERAEYHAQLGVSYRKMWLDSTYNEASIRC